LTAAVAKICLTMMYYENLRGSPTSTFGTNGNINKAGIDELVKVSELLEPNLVPH